MVRKFKESVKTAKAGDEGRQLTPAELKFVARPGVEPSHQENIAQLAAGFHQLSPIDFPYRESVLDFPRKSWARKHPRPEDEPADSQPARRLSDAHPAAANMVKLSVLQLKQSLDTLAILSEAEPVAEPIAAQIATYSATLAEAFAGVSTASRAPPPGGPSRGSAELPNRRRQRRLRWPTGLRARTHFVV